MNKTDRTKREIPEAFELIMGWINDINVCHAMVVQTGLCKAFLATTQNRKTYDFFRKKV